MSACIRASLLLLYFECCVFGNQSVTAFHGLTLFYGCWLFCRLAFAYAIEVVDLTVGETVFIGSSAEVSSSTKCVRYLRLLCCLDSIMFIRNASRLVNMYNASAS